MKNLIISVINLFIFFCSVFSQPQWIEQNSGITTALYSINAMNNYSAWTCGANGVVLNTINGGANWVQASSPNGSMNLNNILALDYVSALVTGSSDSACIFKTTDQGNVWKLKWSQVQGHVYGMSKLYGGTIGAAAKPIAGLWILPASLDYGEHWIVANNIQQGNEHGWDNAILTWNCKAWIGTNNTRLYHGNVCLPPTENQPSPGLINTMSIWISNTVSDTVLLAGGETLLKSTDYGYNWSSPINVPGSGNILGITGHQEKWWLIRGNTIYYSSNNGENWVLNYTAPSGTYTHIYKSPSGLHIWAVRDNGGISFTTGEPNAIEPISNEIPAVFNLYQNYPNPFNPVTNIKFDLPDASEVKLTVFDILGREVEVLVNEFLKPGTYRVDWDASSYPSGAYFYKLETTDYKVTKKMVLIK